MKQIALVLAINKMNNCKEIIILLNDKHNFNGKKKFFKFNPKNREEQTPLDLCCLSGNQEVFLKYGLVLEKIIITLHVR
jgi:hypothetical protein